MPSLAIAFSIALLMTGASLPPSGQSPQPSTLHTNDRAPAYDDVDRTYEELLAKPLNERTQLLLRLPSSMKSRIWAHHLLTALAQHPEFTDEQRAVIDYGLSLMTPQLFEIDPSSVQWRKVAAEPLSELTKRAKAAFPMTLARELFIQLGPYAARNHVDRAGGLDTGPLRDDSVEPSDVNREYDQLITQTVMERKITFAHLSPSMKSGVWSRHLLTALPGHPELTQAQREVILYALSIIRPQLFEMGPSDACWKELVDEPVQELKKRALAAFPPALARELFFHLGPDHPPSEPASGVKPSNAGSVAHLKVSPLDGDVIGGPCTCNDESDWCDTSGLGISKCVGGACFFTEHGCGTLLVYGCNGKCKSVPL